jgi:FkbM family methyltransferase
MSRSDATITTHGHVMRLWHHNDHIGRQLATGTLYEHALLAWTQRELRLPADSLVIDVGAHIGTHTLFWAMVTGCRVLAFEPYAPSYELLVQNIARNGVADRVQAVPLALGETPARAGCCAPPDNLGMARIVPGCDTLVVPLDGWTLLQRPSLLKIDVEGMEYEVLCGARRTLTAYRPHLFIEAHTPERLEAIDGILRLLGYTRGPRFCATPTYYYAPPSGGC